MGRFRLLPLLLTLILLVSASPAAMAEELLIAPNPTASHGEGWLVPPVKTYSGTLKDAEDAWCSDAIRTVYEAGLMEGKTSDRFDYTSPLTYAQITVITARLHELLNGDDGKFPAPIAGEVWYSPALNHLRSIERRTDTADRLLDNMTLWGSDPTLPNRPCTREDFALMLLSILPELPVLNEAAAPDLPAAHPIQSLYRAGIVGGSDNFGTFHPESSLTRGAAAAILARIADPAQRLHLELTSFDICRDVLGIEPDTVLLTMDGEDISAEVFAYACVESGYLQNVSDAPPWGADTIERGVLDYLRSFGAYALMAKDLPAGDALPKAKTLAGTGGISETGWARILKTEGDIAAVKDHYATLYPVSGPHFFYEQTPEAHIQTALRDIKPQVSLEPATALASINWGDAYLRALHTPCAGSYSLNPAFLTK